MERKYADQERVIRAMRKTRVLRRPKQSLVTFGNSTIHYYVLSEPVYVDKKSETPETVIREGKVVAERPRVVTPYYLLNLEGFSDHARKYLEMMADEHGAHAPGLFYKYQNQYQGLSIVSDPLLAVKEKLSEELNKSGEKLAAIIKGVDEFWDVSLLKFIHDFTERSLSTNVTELGMKGLLDVDDRGVPGEARQRIEDLLRSVKAGEADPTMLKLELDRWGLFAEYEDKFLALFKKGM